MMRPPKRYVWPFLATCLTLFVTTSCPSPGSGKGGGVSMPHADLIVVSADVKITGSLPGKLYSCDVEVVIKNQGKAPVDASEGPIVVSTMLKFKNPPSGAYLPPTLVTKASALGGPLHPSPEPVQLELSGGIDVGQSKTLHAGGVLDTRGSSEVLLVVTVDDCTTGKPMCKIEEVDEHNNTLEVPLGNIGKAP